MLLLPEGEGRGEGERILGMPQRCGFCNHLSESGFQRVMNFLAPAAFAFAAAIPVVILSVRTDPRDKVAAFASGAVTYLEKPFKKKDLVDAVRSALELAARRKRRGFK